MDLDKSSQGQVPIHARTKKTPYKTGSLKKPFKCPRTIEQATILSSEDEDQSGDDSTSTTEEIIDIEPTIRDACADWLSIHGSKLFALESSKWLAKQKNPRVPLQRIG